ncbi:MAG TPA: type II secretion system F family protein [Lachnospiraceae bacterium]|nr:type II secretion system F family protein [Lachnospiraceae bacterium]
MPKMLTNRELSSFCDQIAMILNAGISPVEGISIMLEDTTTTEGREILGKIAKQVDAGQSFHTSISAAGVFPKYALDMIEIGEHSGRLEEVMRSLSTYYEREENIAENIKSAVTYPFVIIGMMMVVILVLIIKVLPVFNQVFIQLGTQMTGFSKTLLNLGTTISNYALVFIIIIAMLVLLYFFMAKTPAGQKLWGIFCAKSIFTRPIYDKIASGRFASGMALTMSSGLDTDQSLEMVSRLVDNSVMEQKVNDCRAQIAEGLGFAEALVKTGIFSSMYSRMISIGYKTGSVETVMAKIASGYEEEVDTRMSHLISVLEPTLVIILSVIVCMILLSVMLPLMAVIGGM